MTAPPRFIYLQLHLLVALLATTAVIGRLITVSAPALVSWRTFLAVLAAILIANIAHPLILRRAARRRFENLSAETQIAP